MTVNWRRQRTALSLRRPYVAVIALPVDLSPSSISEDLIWDSPADTAIQQALLMQGSKQTSNDLHFCLCQRIKHTACLLLTSIWQQQLFHILVFALACTAL